MNMKPSSQTAGTLAAHPLPASSRHQTALVTLLVLLAHAGLLGWLQASPSPVQPPELAVVTMELVASPAPVQASRPAPKPEPRKSEQAAPKPAPKQPSAAETQTEPSTLPTTAPSVAAVAASAGSATAAVAPAAPAKVELPSASADYLNNPKPAYPPLSRRLREEGKVVLRVLIEADGSASRAEIRHSSGHERLDQAALQTVLKWRYVPARRNGIPESMWFNIPINFILE